MLHRQQELISRRSVLWQPDLRSGIRRDRRRYGSSQMLIAIDIITTISISIITSAINPRGKTLSN
jgi:hypothetical protein